LTLALVLAAVVLVVVGHLAVPDQLRTRLGRVVREQPHFVHFPETPSSPFDVSRQTDAQAGLRRARVLAGARVLADARVPAGGGVALRQEQARAGVRARAERARLTREEEK